MKILVFLLGLTCCLPLAAQDNEEGEVVVIADLSRAEVVQFIEEVEEDLYRIFNANNDDDAYDIFCNNIVPTGSNRPVRSCEPKFLTDARARNVNDSQFGADTLLTDSALRRTMQSEFEELERKMEAMVTEQPRFAETFGILDALRRRLAEIDGQ